MHASAVAPRPLHHPTDTGVGQWLTLPRIDRWSRKKHLMLLQASLELQSQPLEEHTL